MTDEDMPNFDGVPNFGCKIRIFIRTNSDMWCSYDKSEEQKQIINQLVEGKCYKYYYTGLKSPIYVGRYLQTKDNKQSFFKEDNGEEICIWYSNDTLIHFYVC